VNASRRARLGKVIAAQLLLVLTAACSVSTPRDAVSMSQTQQQNEAVTGNEAAQLGAPAAGLAPTDPDQAAADAPGLLAPDGTSVAPGPGGTVTSDANGSGGGGGGNQPTSPTGAAGSGEAGSAPQTASGPTVGVTAKEIRFSVLYGKSGMYGQILDGVVESGFGTWVADVNSRGGINGRQVRMIKVDNKDTVEGGISGCKEIQNNKSYFAFSLVGLGGADVSATDCLDRAGVPTISYLVSAYNERWKNVYTISEPGVTTRPLASHIKNFLKRGDTKIGLFIERDPLFMAGKQPFLDGMKEQGLKVIHTETVAPGQSSYVSEISRMKNAGAETVVMIVPGPSGIGIPRDARAVNYSPTFTGAIWAHDEFSRGAASIWSGMQALRYYASINSPAYPKFVATAKKHGRDGNTSGLVFSVYGLGLVLQEVLQNAGAAPTRPGFGPAVEKVVNYENGIVGVSFGPGQRRADGLQYPVRCCNPDNTWKGDGAPKSKF
jgi:ABC-type branched-subunit amino acid transport system substrate-binding protein